MHRIRWFALAAAVVVPTALACSSFTAAPPVEDTADASADATADVVADATSADPCVSETLLVGSRGQPTDINDDIAQQGMDVYGYKPLVPGIAQCAHLYIRQGGLRGPVTVGVYADGSNVPTTLVTIAVIERPVPGWNAARLRKSVTVDERSTYWLGAVGNDEVVPVLFSGEGNCPPGGERGSHFDYSAGTGAPEVFPIEDGHGNPKACGLQVYLSP